MRKASRRPIKAIPLIAILAGIYVSCGPQGPATPREGPQLVVINEALRTLLYLPLYHAKERGYFEDQGLDVEIVTGGTATNSFAAMLSGEAHFSQADPMYVPISNNKGAETQVVAQVVGRIAVWGVTTNPSIDTITKETLSGRTIATHPRPMTAYTYTVKTIRDLGLEPERDVKIIQSTPGTEIVPLLAGRADFALTLEPNTSRAVAQGAHVVLSYPTMLGDQVFTGLMARTDFIDANRETVVKVVRAYQQALSDLRSNAASGISTARKYFPEIEEDVLRLGVERMVAEKVIPESVEISQESWQRAIAVRVAAGDLPAQVPLEDGCNLDIMREVARVNPD